MGFEMKFSSDALRVRAKDSDTKIKSANSLLHESLVFSEEDCDFYLLTPCSKKSDNSSSKGMMNENLSESTKPQPGSKQPSDLNDSKRDIFGSITKYVSLAESNHEPSILPSNQRTEMICNMASYHRRLKQSSEVQSKALVQAFDSFVSMDQSDLVSEAGSINSFVPSRHSRINDTNRASSNDQAENGVSQKPPKWKQASHKDSRNQVNSTVKSTTSNSSKDRLSSSSLLSKAASQRQLSCGYAVAALPAIPIDDSERASRLQNKPRSGSSKNDLSVSLHEGTPSRFDQGPRKPTRRRNSISIHSGLSLEGSADKKNLHVKREEVRAPLDETKSQDDFTVYVYNDVCHSSVSMSVVSGWYPDDSKHHGREEHQPFDSPKATQEYIPPFFHLKSSLQQFKPRMDLSASLHEGCPPKVDFGARKPTRRQNSIIVPLESKSDSKPEIDKSSVDSPPRKSYEGSEKQMGKEVIKDSSTEFKRKYDLSYSLHAGSSRNLDSGLKKPERRRSSSTSKVSALLFSNHDKSENLERCERGKNEPKQSKGTSGNEYLAIPSASRNTQMPCREHNPIRFNSSSPQSRESREGQVVMNASETHSFSSPISKVVPTIITESSSDRCLSSEEARTLECAKPKLAKTIEEETSAYFSPKVQRSRNRTCLSLTSFADDKGKASQRKHHDLLAKIKSTPVIGSSEVFGDTDETIGADYRRKQLDADYCRHSNAIRLVEPLQKSGRSLSAHSSILSTNSDEVSLAEIEKLKDTSAKPNGIIKQETPLEGFSEVYRSPVKPANAFEYETGGMVFVDYANSDDSTESASSFCGDYDDSDSSIQSTSSFLGDKLCNDGDHLVPSSVDHDGRATESVQHSAPGRVEIGVSSCTQRSSNMSYDFVRADSSDIQFDRTCVNFIDGDLSLASKSMKTGQSCHGLLDNKKRPFLDRNQRQRSIRELSVNHFLH